MGSPERKKRNSEGREGKIGKRKGRNKKGKKEHHPLFSGSRVSTKTKKAVSGEEFCKRREREKNGDGAKCLLQL